MPAAFAFLATALFADVLFTRGRVAGAAFTDLQFQYVFWREFAFSHIRHGHFPLWNPHALCGSPFFADPQAAMLYPPNALFIFLPFETAWNVLTAVHVFLAAWIAGLWCRRRGAAPAARSWPASSTPAPVPS